VSDDEAGGASISAETPFEELLAELDAVVDRLERGDVHVDEAIRLWRRGDALYRACAARLEAAELQVEELTRPQGSGDNGAPAV
jgi:exodeoxyribonuclease VII small subunit